MDQTLTFITTCRGRLEHLKQSLPRMVQQPGTSCIVVDYDCPDGAGDWVEANFPQVHVVRSGTKPHFEISRARNIGAAVANGDWLCFIDADTLLAPHFMQTIFPLLKPGGFYVAEQEIGQIAGMCIVRRQDFETACGYDAVLQGWGSECKDFYRRLEMADVERRSFPTEPIQTIKHSNELRVQHYEVKDGFLTSTINIVYCRAKWDMMRHGKPMVDEQERATFYEMVSNGMISAAARETTFTLRVPVASLPTLAGPALNRSILYEIGPLPRDAGLQANLRE